MTSITPTHHSRLSQRARAGLTPRPRKMSRIAMPHEAREAAEKIAVDIFMDMASSGASFQESLLAIYLSGSAHAVAAMRGKLKWK